DARGRGAVGHRAGAGAGGGLGGRVPGARRRGRLLPATVHSGQPVPATAYDQRGRGAGGVRARRRGDREGAAVTDLAGGWRGPVIMTGTDTGVGKTIVTAAVAAAATQFGLRVAVLKPGQTGAAGDEEADADTVLRLAAPATVRTVAA